MDNSPLPTKILAQTNITTPVVSSIRHKRDRDEKDTVKSESSQVQTLGFSQDIPPPSDNSSPITQETKRTRKSSNNESNNKSIAESSPQQSSDVIKETQPVSKPRREVKQKTYHGRTYGKNWLLPISKKYLRMAEQVMRAGYNAYPPFDPSATPSERRDWLHLKKLTQNKASVKACRIRRQGYIEALEDSTLRLRDHLKQLEQRRNMLRLKSKELGIDVEAITKKHTQTTLEETEYSQNSP